MTNLSFLYYSPTGATAEIGRNIARGIVSGFSELDLTRRDVEITALGTDDLVVVAVPVFSGRVPGQAIEKIKLFKGQATKAVSLVVYGNRAYEDALLELNDTLEKQGFAVIASGAFIARHSIINEIAAGRPDKKDKDFAEAFAARIKAKLTDGCLETVRVPGNRPHREVAPGSITPLTADTCITCGKCAILCPVEAIPEEDPTYTAPGKCTLCMRCVCVCPPRARALPAEYRTKVAEMLARLAGERRENELFV